MFISSFCSVPADEQPVKQAEAQPPVIFTPEELDEIEAMIKRAG